MRRKRRDPWLINFDLQLWEGLVMNWVLVSPFGFTCWLSNPQCANFRRSWGWTSHNWPSCPGMETLGSSYVYVIGQNKTFIYEQDVGYSPDVTSTSTQSFPASRLSSISVCCLSQPAYSIFVIVTQIDSGGEPGGVSSLVILRGENPLWKPSP